MFAAGILPMSIRHDGTPVFLVGRDVRDSTWSDFGGKHERVDRNDPMNTAAREFYEETFGCVVSQWGIRQRLPTNSVALKGSTKNGYVYHMFVAQIPYAATLPRMFSKFATYVKLNAVHLLEKTEVKWVTIQELFDIPKRHAFAATIERNTDTLHRLAVRVWSPVVAAPVVAAPVVATEAGQNA